MHPQNCTEYNDEPSETLKLNLITDWLILRFYLYVFIKCFTKYLKSNWQISEACEAYFKANSAVNNLSLMSDSLVFESRCLTIISTSQTKV